MPRKPDAEDLAQILQRVIPSVVGSRAMAEIIQQWPDVVGPLLASRTRPVTIIKNELIIEADDAAVAQELRFLQLELRQKLSRWLRPTTGLRIQVRKRYS